MRELTIVTKIRYAGRAMTEEEESALVRETHHDNATDFREIVEDQAEIRILRTTAYVAEHRDISRYLAQATATGWRVVDRETEGVRSLASFHDDPHADVEKIAKAVADYLNTRLGGGAP